MNSFCLISWYHFDNTLATAGMLKLYLCFMSITQLYHGKSFLLQHVHIHPYFINSVMFLLLWFSFLSFYSDHLHEDEIISVLQLVQWMTYFITFFCIYDLIFAYLLSVYFFVFVYCHFPWWNMLFLLFLLLNFWGNFS